MKDYCTFRIGGEAELLIEINGVPALLRLLPVLDEDEFFVIGKGSNLLIDDGYIKRIFLHMGDDFSGISSDGAFVTAAAGAKLASVCKFAADAGLTGMEPLYGIPGTIGGAVFMNAGAYGTETADIVEAVTTLTKAGRIKRYTAADCEFAYRDSVFRKNGEVIVSVKLRLLAGEREAVNSVMGDYAERRRSKQPLEYPSAGSTFKRPEGAYASALIDSCGLKGTARGGAEVSDKHAGFIINKGGATFSDVLDLMDFVKGEVFRETGYKLEPEPIIIKAE
jgi:UDP-N-acetylmuramate dehydrogenase